MRSVMVVDDNRYLAKTTAMVLEPLGYEVHIASNAKQALQLATAHDIDAALIDIDLKGRVNGVDLLNAMRTLRPTMRAVLTTGLDTHDVDAPEDVPVLRKPYRATELANVFQGV